MRVTNKFSWQNDRKSIDMYSSFLTFWFLLPLYTIPGNFIFNSQFEINVLSRHDYYNF